MQQYENPRNITVPAGANLTGAVFDNARQAPDNVAFSVKSDGGWRQVNSKEFAEQVTAVAKGLIASGVEAGDRVGLMSHTSYEWTLLDYAIWVAGGVTVPVYETSSAEQVAWYLGDSEAVAAVVETAEHEKTLTQAREQLPAVKHVWQIEGGAVAALTEAGRQIEDSTVEQRRSAAGPDSPATIIYTSGTTGRPKGCELTHGNLIFDVLSVADAAEELFNPEGATLLFLPLAHVFARLIQVGCVSRGVRMGHTADIKNLMPDLQSFAPTFLLSVPRVFEKVYNSAKQRAHAQGSLTGFIFDRAESVAISYSQALDDGGPSLALKVQHQLYERLVYGKLRAVLGGAVDYAVSGGAPLGARLGHFFRGIGMVVLEGYGLTETSAGATINLPGSLRIGTVGRAIPGAAVRIGEDGEILLRGGNVFRGYWHNEGASKEILTGDGWFHTGDIGELDEDGFLRITGRKKELIVTAGGKNVSPAVLEDRIRAHPLVSQAMVVGDQKPFIGCLVTIDEEALPGWKSERGKEGSLADLREDEQLRADIQAAVDDANKAVSKAEGIKKFRILPVDFSEEGGQLTPTLKLKRNVVQKDFEDEIAAIYS